MALPQKLFYLLMLLALISCTPEEKTWTVQYRVVQTGNEAGTFRATYATKNGVLESKGNITELWWNSPEILEVPDGALAELTVEQTAGNGSYQLIILVNGSPIAEGEFDTPATELTVRDNI